MKLSPHFTLEELTKTEVAAYRVVNASPHPHLLAAGKALCETLLQPIRNHFDKPVIVNSGYRCAALNRAIGGSATSQHVKFEAADFFVRGVQLEEVWEWIYKKSGLKFGQCILEAKKNRAPSWIHLSLGSPWRPVEKCQQVLRFDGERYTRV